MSLSLVSNDILDRYNRSDAVPAREHIVDDRYRCIEYCYISRTDDG